MIPILEARDWVERLLSAEVAEQSAQAGILAFYDHRLRVVVRDPRCAMVPFDDHLVHRGDGVFEYIRFQDRRILNLDGHLSRLRDSAAGLDLIPPCPWDELREIVLRVASAGGRDSGALRVLLGRGQGGFGIDPAECPKAGLYVAAHAVSPLSEEIFARGLSACRSAVPVKPAMLARLKTTNYLPNVLMTLEAAHRGVDVSLAFDDDGWLAEAAVANVALVDAAGVLIMPEFRNALPGTTARTAARLAEGWLPVVWRPVAEEELWTAQELVLLGTAHECVSVVMYEGRPIGVGTPGPISRSLRTRLRAVRQREAVAF